MAWHKDCSLEFVLGGGPLPAPSWTDEIAGYYRSEPVQARLAEYCGGAAPPFDCRQLASYGGVRRLTQSDGGPVPGGPREWPTLLSEGADVCRSLLDRGGTLLQLDVDYLNPSDPSEAYRQPEVTFARLEPVYAAVRSRLEEYGALASVLMTGRGYHFTLRAPFGSPLHAALVAAASPSPLDPRAPRGRGATGPAILGHEGAGRFLEHLAHGVLFELRGRTDVPVTLADVPPPNGGAFICLDLTAYADPVVERYARCAFSSNQKSGMQRAAPERPFVIVLPRTTGQSYSDLLAIREDPTRAATAAGVACASIPDLAAAPRWVESYRAGPVCAFHREFDAGPQADASTWSYTYDTVDPGDWPPCIGVPLAVPNPLLLKPVHLRSVSLGLWALGWHPRSIAGLIRSKYERDFRWGALWTRYDAATRAEFYVRVFCGAAAHGLESCGDFTCATQAGRGLCQDAVCYGEQRQLFEWLGEALERLAGR